MIAFAEVCGKHTIPNGPYTYSCTYSSESEHESPFTVYPWSNLPDGAILCDVGGGNGHISLDILKAFPQLRVIVQDLEVMKEPGVEVRFFVSYHEGFLFRNKLLIFISYGRSCILRLSRMGKCPSSHSICSPTRLLKDVIYILYVLSNHSDRMIMTIETYKDELRLVCIFLSCNCRRLTTEGMTAGTIGLQQNQ